MKTLCNPTNKDEILRRLGTIQPSSKRLWGSMSAHNMICHLSDGFRLYMGEAREARSCLSSAAAGEMGRTLGADSLAARIQNHARNRPEHRGTCPTEFSKDMRELRELIERFTQTPGRFCADGHPHFGCLSKKEWMRLGYLHVDHHLRQFGT